MNLRSVVVGAVAGGVLAALALVTYAEQHFVTRREYVERRIAEGESRQDVGRRLERIEGWLERIEGRLGAMQNSSTP